MRRSFGIVATTLCILLTGLILGARLPGLTSQSPQPTDSVASSNKNSNLYLPSSYIMGLSAQPTGLHNGQKLPITATLEDANGSPVGGAVITFTASAGTFAPMADTTDSQGQAQSHFEAPPQLGPVHITATTQHSNTLISKSTTLTVTQLNYWLPLILRFDPLSITVTANPATINIQETSDLQVTVRDANGKPVADHPISWTIDPPLGAIAGAQSTTNDAGVATARFGAGITSGDVTIIVNSGNFGNLKGSTIVAIQPDRVPLTESAWIAENPSQQTQPVFQTTPSPRLLIGESDTTRCTGQLPAGAEWRVRSKPRGIPGPAQKAYLHVNFILHSLDSNPGVDPTYDYFEISVKKDGQPVGEATKRYANETAQYGCDGPITSLQKQYISPAIEVTTQTDLSLELLVTNKPEGYYNTWVEITDVYVIWTQ